MISSCIAMLMAGRLWCSYWWWFVYSSKLLRWLRHHQWSRSQSIDLRGNSWSQEQRASHAEHLCRTRKQHIKGCSLNTWPGLCLLKLITFDIWITHSYYHVTSEQEFHVNFFKIKNKHSMLSSVADSARCEVPWWHGWWILLITPPWPPSFLMLWLAVRIPPQTCYILILVNEAHPFDQILHIF